MELDIDKSLIVDPSRADVDGFVSLGVGRWEERYHAIGGWITSRCWSSCFAFSHNESPYGLVIVIN